MQLVGDAGGGLGRSPSVVDEIVVPRLASLVEQPPVCIAFGGVSRAGSEMAMTSPAAKTRDLSAM